MKAKYNDHWRSFVKKGLRNIDYLNFGIHLTDTNFLSENMNEQVIDELSYKVELMNLTPGTEIIKAGKI